ncbi:hypothetical protein [Mucilaginibacter psychrotolerans]|uniref:Uncharacterized protein n=1 Tax=Mucilaginibacter psychrotolerans TaxID=1524096 RepID=A0A4Y8SQA3_9SPHI|nr:hypothetical protein [Mucilaginibacter psychrotolerans]TFF40790.1 hypothetical protein E2R66_01015 [Mucilaginibacter psychrotolerans]
MDIEQVWKGHMAETSSLPDMQSIAQLKPANQSNPLKKMKKLLVKNMVGVACCIAFYVIIIYFFNFWQIRVLIGITLLFTLWALATAWQLYRSADDQVSATNLLDELKRNRDALNLWMRIQMRVSVFIYPFSAAGGYLWGGVLGSGKDVAAFMSKPIAAWALIACIIVLTPLGYLAGKWMFKKTFGKVITQLDENIASLSADAA